VELRGPPAPDLGPGAGVGAGAAVLRLAAHGRLPAHRAEDDARGAAGEHGSRQPGHDHGLRALPVCLPRAVGLHAAVTGTGPTGNDGLALNTPRQRGLRNSLMGDVPV